MWLGPPKVNGFWNAVWLKPMGSEGGSPGVVVCSEPCKRSITSKHTMRIAVTFTFIDLAWDAVGGFILSSAMAHGCISKTPVLFSLMSVIVGTGGLLAGVAILAAICVICGKS